MLKLKELRWNIIHLKILSHICFFPFTVDRNTGEIQIQSQRWRRFLFYFHYAYSIFQILFYIATWLLQLVYPEMMRIRDFPMHCVVIAAFVMLFSWSTSLYLVWPETTVLIFNEMFSYEDRKKKQGREYSKVKMNWRSYSLQELFVIIAPCTLYGATFVGGFVFLLKPRRIFTVFILVQQLGFEHKYLHAACTGIDIFLLIFPTSVSAVGIFFQVLFFLRIFSLIKEKMQNLQNPGSGNLAISESIDSGMKLCRRLQLEIQLFNHNFAYVCFSYKIYAITSSILYWFAAFKFYSKYPVEGAAYFILGLDFVILFVLMYDKAFGVPGTINKLKNSIRKSSKRFRINYLYNTKMIQSVPCCGIKVGGFHTFERTSTPTFVDFIVTNLVALILTNK